MSVKKRVKIVGFIVIVVVVVVVILLFLKN